MDIGKEVEFSDTKSLESKRSPWKTKIVVSGVVAVVLLLSAMVSMAVYFSLLKQWKPDCLVEINLKEGETLTYQVDQHIQLQGSDVQQGKSLFYLTCTLKLPFVRKFLKKKSTVSECYNAFFRLHDIKVSIIHQMKTDRFPLCT